MHINCANLIKQPKMVSECFAARQFIDQNYFHLVDLEIPLTQSVTNKSAITILKQQKHKLKIPIFLVKAKCHDEHLPGKWAVTYIMVFSSDSSQKSGTQTQFLIFPAITI